jgi:cellulose synthase/poly-beta-1,6-N-acetylglucosamine synthase-like glycosyltransferase
MEDSDHVRSNAFRGRVYRPRAVLLIIVPARHEEEVLAGTLSRLVALNRPAVEILVVVGEEDEGIRATAQPVRGKPHRLRVLTDHSRLKNKLKALDTAPSQSAGAAS